MKSLEILVATDLSDLGNRAFAAAEQYRKINGGIITPVHALNEPVWPEGIRLPSVDDKMSSQLIRYASAKCAEAAGMYTDPEFLNKPWITYGDPARVIVEKSADHDLVVLSTHGRTGFKKFMLGSVANKVCLRSLKPVMVTSPNDKITSFSKILLSTDFSRESFKSFEQARYLLEHTDATFELVHIVSLEYAGKWADRQRMQRDAEEKLESITKEHFSEFEGRVEPVIVLSALSVHRALSKHIDDGDYDLVIISTAGKTGIDSVLMGSTTAHVIQVAQVPVLTIRP